MTTKRIILLAISGLLVITQSLHARQTAPAEVDVRFIPDAAFASVTVFPQKLNNDKQFEAFPHEVVTAWGKRELGIDPMQAKQITMIAQSPGDLQSLQEGPPKWAAIMHFATKQTLGGTLMEWLEKDASNGQLYLGNQRRGIPSFLVVDDKTILAGDHEWFDDLRNASGDSRLGQLMKTGLAEGGDVVAVVDVKKVRPLLSEMLEEMPRGVPPTISRLKEIPELLDSKLIFVDLKAGKLKLKMNGVDAESAARTKKLLVKAMSFGSDMALAGAATQMNTGDTVQLAGLEYFERLSGILQRDLEPQINGKELTVEVKDLSVAVVPTLVGMLLPAVQAARTAARRTQSMNNLRQLALACLNYESAYMRFPTQANYDDDGKPLLSWRVHVLPFIEQNNLYKQFHLDEPWDSDHNKKLIKLMPPVYDSPQVDLPEGKTVYLGVAGEGAIFSEKKIGFGQITDGSSNTALVVEANKELAVEWTKPQDYECDPKNPLKGLGDVQNGGFLSVLADGSVHFVTNTLDPDNWKWMTKINDGNIVEWDF
jgi:hypothetical protein